MNHQHRAAKIASEGHNRREAVMLEKMRLCWNGGAREETMRSRRRWIIVGLVAVCGVLFVALGIQGLGKLLDAGKIPGEMLTSRVRSLTVYTTAVLSLGLTMISWCFITGLAWARAVQPGVAGREVPPS
jgi:hypothetical protein